MCPPVGDMFPARMFSSVDFPVPLSPMIAHFVPRETDVVEPDVPVRMYIREILNL